MIVYLTATLLLAGGLFAFLAALGVLRLPDLLTRMHASTKAGTLGAGMILTAVAVHAVDGSLALRAIVAVAFLLLTAPVAAHMIGRAAYHTGAPACEQTVIDELAQSLRSPAAADGRATQPPLADHSGETTPSERD